MKSTLEAFRKLIYTVKFWLILFLMTMVSGCAATGANSPDDQPLRPKQGPSMEKPVLVVGYTLYRKSTAGNEEESWRVIEVGDGGEVTARNSDGCIWQVAADWVPPNLSWKDCGSNPKWNSGSRKITNTTGTIWPLAVGNKVSYTHEYEFTSGITGSGVRECEVTAYEPVSVPMGEFEAFEIECKDSYSKHFELTRWYFAPGVGEIKYMREHSVNGVIREVEAVRVENGQAVDA